MTDYRPALKVFFADKTLVRTAVFVIAAVVIGAMAMTSSPKPPAVTQAQVMTCFEEYDTGAGVTSVAIRGGTVDLHTILVPSMGYEAQGFAGAVLAKLPAVDNVRVYDSRGVMFDDYSRR